jgi:hypothetical protein
MQSMRDWFRQSCQKHRPQGWRLANNEKSCPHSSDGWASLKSNAEYARRKAINLAIEDTDFD